MDCGTVVWAGGTAPRSVVKKLTNKLGFEDQRKLPVDGFMRVKGSNGTIFAMGDNALFEKAGERAASE